ncbi:aldo/keto reductase [Anatilimnocola floriformis]|uniref:aldo/keto reductase n=1 Tax=Anatilimnocola floriformis TaxID=2948575 RepID=UPI0020C2DDBA|nr:aldo/keto reductase [Anatilimnocola floriformis]
MKFRRLGRTNWQVSEIGYGMWGMAGWTGSDLDEVNRALRYSVELGCNFFDTAWGYGAGKSEAILGQLVRDFPDRKLYTATKIPPKNWKWPSRREFTLEDCFPPEHIEKYVTDSLKNAGLPSFDLMQFHTWEDSWLQDDRWYHKLSDLKSQGLFHAIGISQNRWEPWNGVAAVKSGLIDCVQVIYNIFDQNPVDELFPACREHDVGVIARVPFDEGTLTGTLTKQSTWPADDWRSSYFVPENLNSSVDHAEALRPLVPANMTMAEMALRFILSEPTVSTIIPGMRSLKNVAANMATSDAGALDAQLLGQLAEHRWDRQPTAWSQ